MNPMKRGCQSNFYNRYQTSTIIKSPKYSEEGEYQPPLKSLLANFCQSAKGCPPPPSAHVLVQGCRWIILCQVFWLIYFWNNSFHNLSRFHWCQALQRHFDKAGMKLLVSRSTTFKSFFHACFGLCMLREADLDNTVEELRNMEMEDDILEQAKEQFLKY